MGAQMHEGPVIETPRLGLLPAVGGLVIIHVVSNNTVLGTARER